MEIEVKRVSGYTELYYDPCYYYYYRKVSGWFRTWKPVMNSQVGIHKKYDFPLCIRKTEKKVPTSGEVEAVMLENIDLGEVATDV